MTTGIRFSGHVQLEQFDRIGPPDLEPVRRADGGDVEPFGRLVDILERPVGREQDAVRAELQHGVEQRGRTEIARHRDVEVGVEIIRDRLLGRRARLIEYK